MAERATTGMAAAEYERYRQRVTDFLWREIEPRANALAAHGPLPVAELFPKLAEHGLFGLIVAQEHGGQGLSISQYVPLLAEMAKVSGVIRVLLHVHNTAARAVDAFGNETQRARWLPRLASGESSMSFAITEPNAGSGADVATRAEREAGEWRVTGAKHYITNADFADLHLVCCRTDPTGGRRGFTALVVPSDAPGFRVEPMPEMMGVGGPPHGILHFDAARVPADSLVGAVGDGLDVFLGELEPSRVFVAASSLGTAARALDIALHFAARRVTFGRTIGSRESVRGLVAEMTRDVYALRTMLADVAARLDRGEDCAVEAAATKLFGLEAVMRVTDAAMEVLGGRAYFRDYPYPLERLYREARLNALEEGTPTIQKLVMGRAAIASGPPSRAGQLAGSFLPHGIDPALGGGAPHDLTYPLGGTTD
jgi:alkylation response protein AidB-like acyl-CoA dehydrogenase